MAEPEKVAESLKSTLHSIEKRIESSTPPTPLECEDCGHVAAEGEPFERGQGGSPLCLPCFDKRLHHQRKSLWVERLKARGNESFGAPPLYRNMSMENWRGLVPPAADEWIKDPDQNLLIFGGVGTGKTHLALGITRGFLLEQRPDITPVWIDAQKLMDELRPKDGEWCDSEDALERVQGANLLILDDYAAERYTEWSADRMSLILRHRHMHMLPTIITSNKGPKEMGAVDERLASRMACGKRIRLGGDDKRKTG